MIKKEYYVDNFKNKITIKKNNDLYEVYLNDKLYDAFDTYKESRNKKNIDILVRLYGKE